jgi:Protein of unknown function (DUF3311)
MRLANVASLSNVHQPPDSGQSKRRSRLQPAFANVGKTSACRANTTPSWGNAMTDKMQQRQWRRYVPRLLLLPFAVVLWPPLYNRIEPEFLGVPFFYWFQLAWILVGAVCVWAVYLLEQRAAKNEPMLLNCSRRSWMSCNAPDQRGGTRAYAAGR